MVRSKHYSGGHKGGREFGFPSPLAEYLRPPIRGWCEHEQFYGPPRNMWFTPSKSGCGFHHSNYPNEASKVCNMGFVHGSKGTGDFYYPMMKRGRSHQGPKHPHHGGKHEHGPPNREGCGHHEKGSSSESNSSSADEDKRNKAKKCPKKENKGHHDHHHEGHHKDEGTRGRHHVQGISHQGNHNHGNGPPHPKKSGREDGHHGTDKHEKRHPKMSAQGIGENGDHHSKKFGNKGDGHHHHKHNDEEGTLEMRKITRGVKGLEMKQKHGRKHDKKRGTSSEWEDLAREREDEGQELENLGDTRQPQASSSVEGEGAAAANNGSIYPTLDQENRGDLDNTLETSRVTGVSDAEVLSRLVMANPDYREALLQQLAKLDEVPQVLGRSS